MAKPKKPQATVVTPPGIAAYAWLDKPDTAFAGPKDKPQYKLTQKLDKNDPAVKAWVKKYQETIKQVAMETWGEVPENMQTPLQDGDKLASKKNKPKPEMAGFWIFQTKSDFQPGLVGVGGPLPEGITVFSGDLVRSSAKIYGYVRNVQAMVDGAMETIEVRGITGKLQNVKLLEKRNGGGGGNPEADFADCDDSDYAPITAPARKASAPADDFNEGSDGNSDYEDI